jgi:multidrug efflux pump subunit AcrB
MARKTRQARKTYRRKLHLGGDQENQSEGFGTLGIALLAAIILVYLVMVGLYDSFIHRLSYCLLFRFRLLERC